MRYTLHNKFGTKVGEAETAQEIGNMATHATFSLDSRPGMAFPYTVFVQGSLGIEGTMCGCETEVADALRKAWPRIL
jgi:hypothetical protein